MNQKKSLVICGKANMTEPVSRLKTKDSHLWMCGTDPREGADCYFELHGLPSPHKNTVRSLPKEVYMQKLPVNSTICAMLVYAYISGYRRISIEEAPMTAQNEYLEQRAAVAYICGWLSAKGVEIRWEGIPGSENYGKK